jgi:dolichyldiphosphatase
MREKQRLLHQLHVAADRSCKYVVVAITFAVAVGCTPPDASSVVVPVVVSMSVATALGGKLLKRLINQRRPAGASKSDGGMPSSHAVSLGYLSTAGSLALLWRRPALWGLPETVFSYEVVSGVMMAAAVYYSWLRAYVGHHSVPQIVVGFIIGASSALLVMLAIYAGADAQRPGGRLDEWGLSVRQGVLAASVAGCTACMVKVGRRWLREDFARGQR